MAITLQYTFVPRTTALSAEVNANFATLATRALDKTGDTLTGTLQSQSIVPSVTATYDLGSTSAFYRSMYIRTSIFLEQTNGWYEVKWTNPGTSRIINISTLVDGDNFAFTDTPQTLSLKTLSYPIISGNVTGNYNLAGTVAITSPIITTPIVTSPTIHTTVAIDAAADNDGLSIEAVATGRPSITFRNETSGLLSRIHVNNDKGMYFYTNGEAMLVAKLHASGAVSIGNTTDAGVSGFLLTTNTIYASSQAFGVGNSGNALKVGRNISGVGAPGMLVFEAANGTNWYVWVDVDGFMHIASTPPTESTGDDFGDIVGPIGV